LNCHRTIAGDVAYLSFFQESKLLKDRRDARPHNHQIIVLNLSWCLGCCDGAMARRCDV